MNEIKIFHCADIHLDSPFTSLSDKEGLPSKRRKALLEAFSRMVQSAREEKPDLLLIAGDLFENDYTRLNTVTIVNSLFSTIPDTRVVMISGNHDPEAANSFYNTFDWNTNVFFIGKGSESISFEDINTVVYGLGWGAGTGYGHRLDNITPEEDKCSILLFHGDIDLQIGDRNYNSLLSAEIYSRGFDYVAAGHNHRKRTYGNRIFNPGSLEPLGFDEPGVHGYFKGSVGNGKEPTVEFVENSKVQYITLEQDISGCTDDTEVLELIEQRTESDNFLYKVILKGTKTLAYSPDASFISDILLTKTLFAKVRDESEVRISPEALSLLKGLKGEFARTAIEQMDSAEDDERELLMKALYYGIEAIEKGKIEKAGGIEL